MVSGSLGKTGSERRKDEIVRVRIVCVGTSVGMERKEKEKEGRGKGSKDGNCAHILEKRRRGAGRVHSSRFCVVFLGTILVRDF